MINPSAAADLETRADSSKKHKTTVMKLKRHANQCISTNKTIDKDRYYFGLIILGNFYSYGMK